MTRLQKWSHRDLPPALRWQAIGFIRTQWPFIDQGLIREPYPSALEPTYYTVSHADELLLSMAATFQTQVSGSGRTWTAACLGNVFTFPAARRQGLGHQVVESATRDIAMSDVDVAALLCDQALRPFYEARGWEPVPASKTVTPDGEAVSSLRMMMFVSTAAATAKGHLSATPMGVPHPW